MVSEVYQLFLTSKYLMQRYIWYIQQIHGFCCQRIATGNIINIFLIKDIFLPSHPTVIDQDDSQTENDADTEAAVLLLS